MTFAFLWRFITPLFSKVSPLVWPWLTPITAWFAALPKWAKQALAVGLSLLVAVIALKGYVAYEKRQARLENDKEWQAVLDDAKKKRQKELEARQKEVTSNIFRIEDAAAKREQELLRYAQQLEDALKRRAAQKCLAADTVDILRRKAQRVNGD